MKPTSLFLCVVIILTGTGLQTQGEDWCNTYGDITELRPKGIKGKERDTLSTIGIKGSQQRVDAYLTELTNYKPCFYEVGKKQEIHPALIAAIASRESNCGASLDNGYGYGGREYGIMQCNLKTSGLNCLQFPAYSCEHINMLVELKLIPDIGRVQGKHPRWLPERQVQGAVAAYNFGVDDVRTWERLDVGTTGGDYSNDVIARAHYLIELGWTCDSSPAESRNYSSSCTQRIAQCVTGPGQCTEMAKTGNCDFYPQCIENEISCGETGYALAYGYKYCQRFEQYYNHFSAEGKDWIDKVRVCLMEELLASSRSPGITCNRIAEIAFKSHVKCYRTSGIGICEVAKNGVNREGLWTVYEVKDFFGPQWKRAWIQVLQTVKDCAITEAKSWFNEAKEALGDAVDAVTDWFEDRRKRSTESTDCEAFASTGDCRFYECFENKFPCAEIFGYSHVRDFELVHCVEFQKFSNNQVVNWMTQTQICLMSHLKPLFLESSVKCASLEIHMYEARVNCMVDNGYCPLQFSDEWTIERGTNDHGYPHLLPKMYTTWPLSGTTHMIKENYYRALQGLKDQIGQAHTQCGEQGLRSSSSLYEMKETKYGIVKIRVDY